MQLRILWNIRKPLRRGISTIKNGTIVFLSLKHEKLPGFCYKCGMLTYTEKECLEMMENPLGPGLHARTGTQDWDARLREATVDPELTILHKAASISAPATSFSDSLGWPRVVSHPTSNSLELVVTAPTVKEPPQVAELTLVIMEGSVD